MDKLTFQPGCFYHIYNRGNNRDDIFFEKANYKFFLTKYHYYLSPFVHTVCYCLLPNHFHLLIKVKETPFTLPKGTKVLTDTDEIVTESFRRLFTSYSKAFNNWTGRRGSLFQKNFKKKLIEQEEYLTEAIAYIHTNPVKHKITKILDSYPYSSYHRIFLPNKSNLEKEWVLEWFGGEEKYEEFHNLKVKSIFENQLVKSSTFGKNRCSG